jgi:glycosyltransferase involved in cell wall biosynthesis
MEWHVLLHRQDFERLGLADDARFHLAPFPALARPAPVPGVRFLWRNTLDQVLTPLAHLGFDIVHFLDSYGPLSPLVRAALVLTVHDLIPLTSSRYHSPAVRAYLGGLMRSTIPRAAAIMADSVTTARQLGGILHVPEQRVTVVPMGVDERFHHPTEEEQKRVKAHYQITGPYVISVGTIEPRKNLARVVRAFARAKRMYGVPHHLLIVGKMGWGYGDVLAAIEEAQLGPAIRLLGYLPREDVPPLIGGADVLLYPSLEEGFGLPVAEGMACGTPVITSSVSSVAEVAGEAGLLVDPLSVEAIAAATGRLCQDAALRASLREVCQVRAGQYTWARVGNATLAIYERLATPRSPGGAEGEALR